MFVYAIVGAKNPAKVRQNLNVNFSPEDYFDIDDMFFVARNMTIVDLTNLALGKPDDMDRVSAVIIKLDKVSGFWGYYNKTLWQWLLGKTGMTDVG